MTCFNFQPPQPSSAPAPAPASGPPAASGRASYRGGAKEPRPGIASGSGDVPADALSKMSIGTKDAGERRDRLFYSDPECKPAWLSDKRGTASSHLLKAVLHSICFTHTPCMSFLVAQLGFAQLPHLLEKNTLRLAVFLLCAVAKISFHLSPMC